MRSLRHLEVFRAVAQTLSFTRAAEQLHLSQPVVSRTVRELERSLGVTLFVRTTRNVSLTPHGAALLEVTDDALGRFDRAMERFRAYCRGEYGRIVIATLPSIAAGVLPPVLVDFVAEHPDTQLEILDVTAAEAARAVESGAADVAIAAPVANPALHTELLMRDRFVAVLPEHHALLARASLNWRALATEPFIAMTRGSSVRDLTDVAMHEAGVTPSAFLEARNISTAGGMVAAGLGVSAFPELVLPLMPSTGIATRPLTAPVMYRDLAIITRAGETPAPPAARLVERLRAASSGP